MNRVWPLALARQERLLGAALGLSLALHAMLLSLHFKLPDGKRWKQENAPLEVVLVNAKTKERPARADVLAQMRAVQSRVPATPPREQGVEEQGARTSGRDLADLALAAMRLQAQIDRQIEEYQKRPRKKFIGANAGEYRFAQYEDDWRVKVERVGTLNYPAEARGRIYGNLRLTVTIRPDGNVESIELDRSSGLKVLDAAAFKIVKMATPFAAFPPDIRRDTDLLVITRTWFFGQGDKIWTE